MPTHISSDYDRVRARHVFQRDAYLGGDFFRTPSRSTLSQATAWTYTLDENGQSLRRQPKRYETYLVPHAAESDESFECRLKRACYLNLVAPIVDGYAESVTAHVTREIPDGFGPMTDVDLRGSTWNEHVEEVARWAALYGYCAAVYDAPAANPARNRAEEQAAGIGPRVVLVQPAAIAWVEVDDDGRLVTFAWVEQTYYDETGGNTSAAMDRCTVTVRLVTLRGGPDGTAPEWCVMRGTIAPSRGMAAQRDAMQVVTGDDGRPMRGPLPGVLGDELPVVFAFYRRLSDSRFPLGQSVADDACDIARSIYCKLSEEDEIHTKAGFPFLAIPRGESGDLDPETKISIGAGRGLAYAAGSGAPQWVQPSPESSQELRASVVFRAAMAFRLAGIEVATDQSNAAESGVALRVRARGFESRAQRFAHAMARYERAGLRLWGKLAGSAEEAKVAYAKRFTLPDPTEDLAAAIQLLTQVPVEIGVEAKVAAVRKALDAVLALSDEEMTKVLDEIRGMLEADKADFDDQRAAGAAERAQRMRGMGEPAEPADAAGGAPSDDASFVAAMVPHHEDALRMARAALPGLKDPALRRIAQAILKTQAAEIDQMRGAAADD